jgi:hypothetical protein
MFHCHVTAVTTEQRTFSYDVNPGLHSYWISKTTILKYSLNNYSSTGVKGDSMCGLKGTHSAGRWISIKTWETPFIRACVSCEWNFQCSNQHLRRYKHLPWFTTILANDVPIQILIGWTGQAGRLLCLLHLENNQVARVFGVNCYISVKIKFGVARVENYPAKIVTICNSQSLGTQKGLVTCAASFKAWHEPPCLNQKRTNSPAKKKWPVSQQRTWSYEIIN